MQIPNAVSKNNKMRQTRQVIPVIGLKALTTTRKVNIVADNTSPIIQANFFFCAPTYSGTCFLTIKRPIINVGENLGFIKTRMRKSVKNKEMTYFTGTKFPLDKISTKEMNTAKNSMPAEALTSRSLRTGILYPSTVSPNCIILFIFLI